MSQFLAPALRPEEEEAERTLRPRRLDDFIGQERVKEQLSISLDAAKARGEALDHVLLAGPPGLGKTTLAQIVREELGVGLRTVAGPALEKKDIAAVLTALEPRDVLFIDEIHRLARAAEEILYPALEDFRLDIVFGQGAAARTLTLDLPPFTLVGATTRTGLLTTPLRDRFGMTFRLGYYDPGQLATIVRRSAGILAVEIADDAAEEIASRSRGTPRIANRILRRVRDVAEVRHAGAITTAVAQEALDLLEVDEQGLERIDRELLDAIASKFGGGPVGLSTLAVSLGEETDTIEEVYEPYLLQLGFLQRTPRGRVITDLGREHLGSGAGRRRVCSSFRRSAAVLDGMPGWRGGELEQGAAAFRLGVHELAARVVPRDVEQALLDPVVEVGAAEHELAQPVHERLAVDECEPLPVPHEIRAERAARIRDARVGGELDEVADLVGVEVVRRDEAELHGRARDPLLEVALAERELVAEELERERIAGRVVARLP